MVARRFAIAQAVRRSLSTRTGTLLRDLPVDLSDIQHQAGARDSALLVRYFDVRIKRGLRRYQSSTQSF
jgi:hypothetical protein